MLQINLLPDSGRESRFSTVEQFHRTPLMLVIIVVMVGAAAALGVSVVIRHQQLKGLHAKIRKLEPVRDEVDDIQRLLRHLRTRQVTFQGLSRERKSLWSKRLNVLSDVTPDGVWFTSLVLDPSKGLVIEGSAIGQGGSEMVSVGRLVQDLKENPDFTVAVEDIQIESIKRVQEEEIEIVQFTLACVLREASTP